jgi:hypothetical protein
MYINPTPMEEGASLHIGTLGMHAWHAISHLYRCLAALAVSYQSCNGGQGGGSANVRGSHLAEREITA